MLSVHCQADNPLPNFELLPLTFQGEGEYALGAGPDTLLSESEGHSGKIETVHERTRLPC